MNQRNYGIDFLRILSMFMVVVLHVLGNDGSIYEPTSINLNYWVEWLIEISAFGAVNCFALISGYVMCNSAPKISKLFNLWLQTAFYTISLFILFAIINRNFAITTFVKSCLPISTKRYWYISAYFGMFFLIPLLNHIVKNIEKKVFDKALITCFIGFCIFAVLIPFSYEPFHLEGGYSTLWLCLMYLVGAYIKKYDIAEKIKSSTTIIIYTIMTVLTFLSKMVIHYSTQAILGKPFLTDIFVSYISPTIVIAAICLFIFCLKISFSNTAKKIISFFAPASLGVYLIHFNGDVWSNVINKIQLNLLNCNPFAIIFLVIGTAIAIYIVCSLLETGRIYIFKALKINTLCLKIESVLQNTYEKIYNRFVKYSDTSTTSK